MSDANIKIPVDLTNPGQFFACCGLLELTSRIDIHAQGYFRNAEFWIETTAHDVLAKFLDCQVEVDTTFQSAESEEDDEAEASEADDAHRGRIYPMRLAEPFNLLLNWWTDKEAQEQKLKLWTAGQRVTDLLLGHHKQKKKRLKGKPDEIVRLYTPSTREHFAEVLSKHPDDWLRKAVPIKSPAAFSFDSRLSRNNALDLGHFTHGTLAFSPAIDVLCLVGFQRFRPETIETWNRNRYCTWNQPLPVIVAPSRCSECSRPFSIKLLNSRSKPAIRKGDSSSSAILNLQGDPMSEQLKVFDYLLKDTGPAAIVLKQWLKPVGDPVIFPPTYANPKEGDPAVYNIDRFGETTSLGKRFDKFKKTHTFMDSEREEHGKLHSVCVIDSIPSQANRIEPAFGRLTDDDGKPIKLVPKVTVKVKIDGEVIDLDLLVDAGHRIADAMLRYTSIGDEVTNAILARKKGDSTFLARLAPTSLIFGMWDSQKSGVKVPRLINSIIRAYDIREHRRSSQFNPAMDFEAAGVTTDKGDKRLSEVGMDGAPSTFQHGGIEAVGGICRDASLNLCTLRDIISTSPEQTLKLQRYILGLSLVAITFFDGKTLNLRQGCQLVAVPDKPMHRVTINADGNEKPFEIDRESAIRYASKAADDFEIGPDRTDAEFDVKAAKAVRKAAKKDKEEDKL